MKLKTQSELAFLLLLTTSFLLPNLAFANISANGSFKLFNGIANPIIQVTTSGAYQVKTGGLPFVNSAQNSSYSLVPSSAGAVSNTIVSTGVGSITTIPDRVSIGAPLILLANESGVLAWVTNDSRTVQVDVPSSSFPSKSTLFIKEEVLGEIDTPVTNPPAIPIGSSSVRVQARGQDGVSNITSSTPFTVKITQPAGKPLPEGTSLYYFDDQNKLWVKVENTKTEGNGFVFLGKLGVKYGMFASTNGQVLLPTDAKTILDVNKDGKIDLADKEILAPIYKTIDTPIDQTKKLSYDLSELITDKETLLKYLGRDSQLRPLSDNTTPDERDGVRLTPEEERLARENFKGPLQAPIEDVIRQNISQKPFEDGVPVLDPSAPTSPEVEKRAEQNQQQLIQQKQVSGVDWISVAKISVITLVGISFLGLLLKKLLKK